MRSIRRAGVLLAALGLAVPPAQATWSIAVMNVRTREVVVAGATCISDFGLMNYIGSVAVGEGGGLSQAYVYQAGKVQIFEGLRAGFAPQQILDGLLNTTPQIQKRAFGIVGRNGPAANFLGTQAGTAQLGITGSLGDLTYSIQGSGLTGEVVIQQAEQALIQSGGDLGQRVMQAMEAAAALGGDGRCSCNQFDPPSCGAPPPMFTHSSYTSFLIIARLGDLDSTTCGNGSAACTNGDYYARLSNLGNINQPDAVRTLQRQYHQWRTDLIGRPDQLLTGVYCSDQLVQADGLDSASIDISLVDINGDPVTAANQTIVASVVDDPGVTLSPVTSNGDGTFSLTVVGGVSPGDVRIQLVVQDGIRDVQLVPDVELSVVTPSELFANFDSLPAGADAQVQFDIFDSTTPGGAYHILASASGTSPGTPWGNLTLPLNADRILRFTALEANGPALPNTKGNLDQSGRATAWVNFRGQELQAFAGSHLDFVAYRAGSPERLSNLVGLDVTP